VPVEVKCKNCNKRFRVPDKYAGKRVKCPGCKGVIDVPRVAPSGAKPSSSAKPSSPAKPAGKTTPAEENQWYLQSEDGEQYGPVSRQELDGWVAEGRIDASCQLLRDGWEQWKWAEDVFPQVGLAGTEAGQDAAEENPFAGIGDSGPQQDINPFASPREAPAETPVATGSGGEGVISPQMIQALAQTRPWVLFLSILGFIFAGLIALGSLIWGIMTLVAIAAVGIVGVAVFLSALVTGAAAALYFFAAYHLNTYATQIAKFLKTKNSADLDRAMVAQKSFWKLVGMVTAIVVGIYVLLFVLMLAVWGLATALS